ncbi:MAG: hypothetical protein PHR92_08500 [Lachnospiraceae bacterium]|nr:hypothetical protein [Lachnospiraceae bacterium]
MNFETRGRFFRSTLCAEHFGQNHKGTKEPSPYCPQAAMDVILKANWEKAEEAKAMCDALNELFAKELEEKEAHGEEKGKEIGKEIGQKAILVLISAMSKGGEAEAIPRLSEDEEFLREMCVKYKIEL